MAEHLPNMAIGLPPTTMPSDVKQATSSTAPILEGQPMPMPVGWLEMKDPSGRTMYFNPSTGAASWERPNVRQLPAGWIKSHTPDGRTIFVHVETRSCSFQWPVEQAAPAQVLAAAEKPQMTRHITEPAQPAPPRVRLVRSSTAPVKPTQDDPLMTMTVNTAIARKNIPDFDEAFAIHQLAQRNNTEVLGKKLGQDVAHVSVALKDTTITAASLATRQAKAVGQTMISRTKMQKASKNAIVHTGALGVKIGRASRTLMHEMVDAADGKGKYKPKTRTFIPQDPLPPTPEPVNHSYEHEQAAASGSQIPTPQQPMVAVKPSTGVPMRKPVRRPLPQHSQAVSLASAQVPAYHDVSHSTATVTVTVETAETSEQDNLALATEAQLQPTSPTEKPPHFAVNSSTSIVPTASGSMAVDVAESSQPLAAPPSTAETAPHAQFVIPPKPAAMSDHHHSTTSFSIQADAILADQTSSNPPPPYTHESEGPPQSLVTQPPLDHRPPKPMVSSPSFPASSTNTSVYSAQSNPTQALSDTMGETQPLPVQQQYILAEFLPQQYLAPPPAQTYLTHSNSSAQNTYNEQNQILVQPQTSQATSYQDAYMQAASTLVLQQQMQQLQLQATQQQQPTVGNQDIYIDDSVTTSVELTTVQQQPQMFVSAPAQQQVNNISALMLQDQSTDIYAGGIYQDTMMMYTTTTDSTANLKEYTYEAVVNEDGTVVEAGDIIYQSVEVDEEVEVQVDVEYDVE